jgi:hypothetical protein
MNRTREISAVAYASLEIAHFIGDVLIWGMFKFSLFSYFGYLGVAAWIAFIVFAAAAFKGFSYRWLRVIAAFLVFYLSPLVVVVIYARTNFLLPLNWLLVSLPIIVILGRLIRLTLAGFIYLWSVRREQGPIAVLSADQVT